MRDLFSHPAFGHYAQRPCRRWLRARHKLSTLALLYEADVQLVSMRLHHVLPSLVVVVPTIALLVIASLVPS